MIYKWQYCIMIVQRLPYIFISSEDMKIDRDTNNSMVTLNSLSEHSIEGNGGGLYYLNFRNKTAFTLINFNSILE